jgi:glutaredoxin
MENIMKFEHVNGENKGEIKLYALSTCVWCKKTKDLLDKYGCDYKYIFVDKLEENDKEMIKNEIKKFNPRFSFPTLVINNKNCIVGYKEEKIREALNL